MMKNATIIVIILTIMMGNILGKIIIYCKLVPTGKESVLLKEEFITQIAIISYMFIRYLIVIMSNRINNLQILSSVLMIFMHT